MTWSQASVCVPKGEITAEAGYQRDQESPRELLEGSWGLGVDWDICLHVYLCVCVQRSVPAIGVGLRPWAFIYPGASSWRDWDPRTGWVSSAAGGIRQAHMYVYRRYTYIYAYIHTHTYT